MTKDQLTDAISAIDQSYIDESLEFRDETPGKQGLLRRFPVAAGIVLAVLLATPAVVIAAQQRPRPANPSEIYTAPYYPEPAVRPDISDIWVWDTLRGAYVLPDRLLQPPSEEITQYWNKEDWDRFLGIRPPKQLNQNAHSEADLDEVVPNPELPKQIQAVKDRIAQATDPLDLALLQGDLYLLEHQRPMTFRDLLRSTTPPGIDADAYEAMKGLSDEAAEHIWTRFCYSASWRYLMLPAMEQYLSIDLTGGYGYFDSYAQKRWNEKFRSLKSSIPAEITAEDVPSYGKLLLPSLCEKETLTEGEVEAFVMLTGTEDVAGWAAEHTLLLKNISGMIVYNPQYRK